MLAIHNNIPVKYKSPSVANAFAKLSKCQQFTTNLYNIYNKLQLQTLLQSYQNVSNSQPSQFFSAPTLRCKRFCKVIKMLAIHNQTSSHTCITYVANAFAKLSKCQQFTTSIKTVFLSFSLQTLLQSYQNVSNSQLVQFYEITNNSCKRFCKVIKMLAIHNPSRLLKL